jgi:hypothetical protein
MIFRSKSNVKNHVSAKRPLYSHKMVEDNAEIKIADLQKDERLRSTEPPTKREEPLSTDFRS